MFSGTNLKNLFLGSGLSRELRETREAWDQTQAYWAKSRLAECTSTELAVEILKDAVRENGRLPVDPVLSALLEAVSRLLDAESIGELEVRWHVIESDVVAAKDFRDMVARRRRWALDFDEMFAEFRRIILANVRVFLEALPESCYANEGEPKGEAFEALVLDLIDEPADIVNKLFMLPYDDDAFRLQIFERLRELCVNNLLVASGFLPTDSPAQHQNKLILPPFQKNKTSNDLAELYLQGSPLKVLLEAAVPFNIPQNLRFEHCHIVGGTGHGKTQLMQRMIYADLVASQTDYRSVIVIDSQGDLINKLTRLELFSPDAPDSLADRLVVIDPSDVDFPAALNLFDAHLARVTEYKGADRERVLNGVVELYELFFGAFLGAELTQKQGVIFKYLARLMLAIPDATIHTLMKIMEDGKPFLPYIETLDGSARYFFQTEFFHPSFAATKKQVLRRLWGVLSTPAFERMFTQKKNKLDLFEAMNEGKIILINTAKDLLKREGSQLLGRFFIAMISQATLERSTLPERLRNAAFVFVDEAQEYFDDSIETILTQARKYHVGITLAHQTLDQLSPRLRSAILANTSMKCAGGLSAKDSRALADELRTTSDFIESMKRRGVRTEFAVWVKNFTAQAIRLSVPLGFLERRPTLAEQDYEALLEDNRKRYCGTLDDVSVLALPKPLPPTVEPQPKGQRGDKNQEAEAAPPKPREPDPPLVAPGTVVERAKAAVEPRPVQPPLKPHQTGTLVSPVESVPFEPPQPKETGKGGKQHRYLQMLVKDLAEQQGFRATVEAPLKGGSGQIDVQLDRDQVSVAVEISVSTPAAYERDKFARCLEAQYTHVAVVLAKTKSGQARFRDLLLGELSEDQRQRVSLLSPEEVPDFIASLAPPPQPTESVVKGYKVRLSHATSSPEDTKARKDALARIIAQSLGRQDGT